jgi:DNA-binding FrmR family transcriptional regulator
MATRRPVPAPTYASLTQTDKEHEQMRHDSGPDAGAGASVGYVANKDAYLTRLRRIEGQVRGLQRMIEQDQYCIDVLTQVSAVTKALQSVALGLLDEHLGHCVTEAITEGGTAAEDKVREASAAVARLVRS